MNRRNLLIITAAGLAAVALIVGVLILPKAAQVRSRQQEVASAKTEESTLRAELQQLQGYAQQAGAFRKQFAQLQKQVPPTADLPGLVRMVNNASAKAGVDFMSIAPSQPILQGNGQVSTIPTQITVSGGYFAVDQFIYLLESLQRVMKVTSIQVTPLQDDATNLQVIMAAEFYTTDISAGPGSTPGHQEGAPVAPAATPPSSGSTGGTNS